jgi:AraC-like DNA-binding protein
VFNKDAHSGSRVFAVLPQFWKLSVSFREIFSRVRFMIVVVILLLALVLALIAIFYLLKRERNKHSQNLDLLCSDFFDEPLRPDLGNLSELLRAQRVFYLEAARKRNVHFSIELPDIDLFYYFDTMSLQRIVKVLFLISFFNARRDDTVSFVVYAIRQNVVLEIPAFGSENRRDFGFLKHFLEKKGCEMVLDNTTDLQKVLRISLPIIAIPKRGLPPVKGARKSEHTLLVLSDDAAFMPFLKKELAQRFSLLTAMDEVEYIALHQVPDLILMDITTEDRSRISLCKRMKAQDATSFIPIVMVSPVFVADDFEQQCHESGVDAFFSLPLNLNELIINLELLIEKQALIRMRTSTSTRMIPSEIALSSMTDRLLHKALVFIDNNISNSDYSIFQLSQDLGMDRTVLYKKLHAITGLPPSEFLRSIRLKRAAHLLVQGGYPVSVVSELVGFNTPKYFAKHFKDAYGVLPSKYALSLKTTNSATFESDNNI